MQPEDRVAQFAPFLVPEELQQNFNNPPKEGMFSFYLLIFFPLIFVRIYSLYMGDSCDNSK
jgi:hypothetical protein